MKASIKETITLNLSLPYLKNSKSDYNRLSFFFLLILSCAALLLKFHLLFQISINQDEFYYLSGVYEHMHDSLTHPMQNFHVHFFGWLSILGPNEVIQIIGARIVMYFFFLSACIYIFLIGRFYLDTIGALFSVLCYISFLFTVANGSSFRSDTIGAFLFLFALYHFLIKKESILYNIAAGLAMAFALVFTIKSAIYLTVFSALILTRLFFLRDFQRTIVSEFAFFLTLFFGYLVIYKLHVATFPGTSIANQAKTIGSTFSTFVSLDRFFPQFGFFKLTLVYDFIIWLILATGIIFYIIDIVKRKTNPINIYLFSLLLPLFSLLFYRNAYPYFYVFITPTSAIFCGYLLWHLRGIFMPKNKIFCLILVVIAGGAVFKNFITHYSVFSPKRTLAQHQTLDVIHKMFSDPVPYIDGCSMVSSFPKKGFFMESIAMESYLNTGDSIIEKLLLQENPLFLLANVPHLNLHSPTPTKSDTNLSFMEGDWQTLKSNFIHHWGDIWVLGKRFEFESENESQNFKIAIPGLYTVEGYDNVRIDGKSLKAGDTIELKPGRHTVYNSNHIGLVNLRWGDKIYKPEVKPVSNHLFLGPFM